MKLSELLKNINYFALSLPEGFGDTDISELCHDSRQAGDGQAFFCKRGAVFDGHKYAISAYDKGARIFVVEYLLDLPTDAVQITVENADVELRHLASLFYGEPSEKLNIVGFTGTKGKTTCALSVYGILRENGFCAGYIGTNGIYYCDREIETVNTTPDCVSLQRTLRDMLQAGVTHVCVEISSQALWQERAYGIKFHTCVFTNLYEDHIGGNEHPDIEHYRACKRRLFTDYAVENIIVNADSPDYEYMIASSACKNILLCSARGNEKADIYAKDSIKFMSGMRPGVSFELYGDFGKNDAFVPIPGLYSVENALLCIGVCFKLGLDVDRIIKSLSRLSVSGRFETVELKKRSNSLFVIDYAHNGASLSAVLDALREYEPKRIICLFGSVGGRTFTRRKDLATVADEKADVIIITTDNPDFEDPEHVVKDIFGYISNSDKQIYLIPDRKEAVEKAYEIAEDGDFVLFAGKGHEKYQLISGERVPFSEREILLNKDLSYIAVN